MDTRFVGGAVGATGGVTDLWTTHGLVLWTSRAGEDELRPGGPLVTAVPAGREQAAMVPTG